MSDYQLDPFERGDEILLENNTQAVFVKAHFSEMTNTVLVKIALDGNPDEAFDGDKVWVRADQINYEYVQYVKRCKADKTRPSISGFHQSK